jgi:hypothetical protein
MAVTAYAASGQLSLSAFRTTVVDASDSVSMSKLVDRGASLSTTTTDIQYTGTNVPWNESGTVGTNLSIPNRTTSDPTPAVAISDFHGAIPWFWTFRTNQWAYGKYQSAYEYDDASKGYVSTYGTKLTWDNVLVYTLTTSFPASITTGGYTYYQGQWTGYTQATLGPYGVFRIGRD